jgi:putative aminopeptidase FrvX
MCISTIQWIGFKTEWSQLSNLACKHLDNRYTCTIQNKVKKDSSAPLNKLLNRNPGNIGVIHA